MDSASVKSWMPMFTYIFSLLNAVPRSFNRMGGTGKNRFKISCIPSQWGLTDWDSSGIVTIIYINDRAQLPFLYNYTLLRTVYQKGEKTNK